MITTQNKKWISGVALLLSLLWATQNSAAVKMMTDDESTAFEKQCASNPKCAEELSKLKTQINNYKSETDALCKKDAAACARRHTEDERQFLEHAAVCEDLTKDCNEQVNAAMEDLEQTRLNTRWCTDNAEQCARLKEERETRKAAGKTWCNTHADFCANAIAKQTQHQKEELAREKQNKVLAEAAQAKKAAEEKRLREKSQKDAEQRRADMLRDFEAHREDYERDADRKYIAENFKCVGTAEDCVAHINGYMAQQIDARKKHNCAKDPKQCSSGTSLKKSTELKADTAPKSWCEENKVECDKAVQRYIASVDAKKKE